MPIKLSPTNQHHATIDSAIIQDLRCKDQGNRIKKYFTTEAQRTQSFVFLGQNSSSIDIHMGKMLIMGFKIEVPFHNTYT